MSLGTNVWVTIDNGFQVLATPSTKAANKVLYTSNAMAKNVILSVLLDT